MQVEKYFTLCLYVSFSPTTHPLTGNPEFSTQLAGRSAESLSLSTVGFRLFPATWLLREFLSVVLTVCIHLQSQEPGTFVSFKDFLKPLKYFLPEFQGEFFFFNRWNVQPPFRTFWVLMCFPTGRDILYQRKLLHSQYLPSPHREGGVF